MGAQEKLDQIAGILSRGEVPFQTREDGQEYRILFGSTAVMLSVSDDGDATAVHLKSPVVVKVDLDDEEIFGKAHMVANSLNRENYFVKFCVYDDYLAAELDLLGDDLQGSELMNGLRTLAEAADGVDDAIADELRGMTYEKFTETDGTQPVTEM